MNNNNDAKRDFPVTGAPLYKAIAKHVEKGRASFHTPGHKGRAGLLSPLHILMHDLTELADTVSLYDGGDALEQAEILAADAFGAAMTLFSAGGCSLCIQTMLMLGAESGSHIVMARNCHRSAVNAAALLGLTPIWAYPTDKSGQISANDIAKALESADKVSAVYITSPDYSGNIAHVEEIAKLCHRINAKLLVDNAHGSHLEAFGLHPLTLGADMTADSSHKTMPVLTGGAMLHIGRKGEQYTNIRKKAKAAMAVFGSTSPSFPVLASLDLMRDWWQRAGVQAFQAVAEQANMLAITAKQNKLCLCTSELQDPTRLTINTALMGVSGLDVAEFFREHACEPEYANFDKVVFILTPFNTPQDIQRLNNAIIALPPAMRRGRFLNKIIKQGAYEYLIERPKSAMPMRDALMNETETVNCCHATGRISARAVCPCPPGIAVIVPGEIISEDVTIMLENCGIKNIETVKMP